MYNEKNLVYVLTILEALKTDYYSHLSYLNF